MSPSSDIKKPVGVVYKPLGRQISIYYPRMAWYVVVNVDVSDDEAEWERNANSALARSYHHLQLGEIIKDNDEYRWYELVPIHQTSEKGTDNE